MIWGWASTSEKWNLLVKSFDSFHADWSSDATVRKEEKIYWDAGMRRAVNGYIDAWDILIARFMRVNGLRAVLPPVPYISNIGNDQFATHTSDSSQFLFRTAESYVVEKKNLRASPEVDLWIRENVYCIRMRHMLSTRITQILDYFRLKPYKKLVLWPS